MHFTVIFEGAEGRSAAYSLCFAPNPCWFLGNTNILALDRSSPLLPANAIKPLLTHLRSEFRRDKVKVNRCIIVVHPEGYGTETDLTRLIADCEAESIRVVEVARF